jgi:NTP pyrophosphatase (non-canonical NTP hydrolase)
MGTVSMQNMNINNIQKQLADFADERDWDQFHNPKNLAMALSVEASELVEIFQWLTPEQAEAIMSSSENEHVKEEIADVMIYLLRLTDKLDIDLESIVSDKIVQNGKKYPVNLSKGNADKSTSFSSKIKNMLEL